MNRFCVKTSIVGKRARIGDPNRPTLAASRYVIRAAPAEIPPNANAWPVFDLLQIEFCVNIFRNVPATYAIMGIRIIWKRVTKIPVVPIRIPSPIAKAYNTDERPF